MGQFAKSQSAFSEEIELTGGTPVAKQPAAQIVKTISHAINVVEEIDLSPVRENSPTDDAFTTYWMSTPRGQKRTLSDEAKAGIQDERNMTFLSGCRMYPVAFAWAVVLSLTVIMEAYDKVLVTSFFASPRFREAYGQKVLQVDSEPVPPEQLYQISPIWQTLLTNGAVTGEIFGLLLHGLLTERLGYRDTMVITLCWMCCAVFLAVCASNIQMLLASQILCGLPWGVIQTLAATYAAEIVPAALRPYLLGNVNMCWVIGQLIGICVVRSTINLESELSYKLPFGLQWLWSVPLLIAVWFAPESPWWLIRKGKPYDARQNLQRLTAQGLVDVDRTMALMIHTNKVERRLGDRANNSYLDCFRGTNRRRTEVACMVWSIQALCGAVFIGYATYFFEQAGFDISHSFNLSVGTCGVAVLGNIIAWALIKKRIGRRTLYLWGLSGCACCLCGAAVASVASPTLRGLNWVVGCAIIVLTLIYDMTIGPICYIFVAEIPSTRMRLRTVILARVSYNVIMVTSNIIVPRMLNPTSWNWKGKSFFPFLATALLCLVWAYFRLPETRGLAHVEMDILFDKKAPARKFGRFQKGLEASGYFSLTSVERSAAVWHGTVGYA